MRPLIITLFFAGAGAAALPARDAMESRPPRRSTDPDHNDHLKQYLAAFRGLPLYAQERVRQLDKDMQEEDAATRARLMGVMERYAQWLSRLSQTDRDRIQAAPAGPERLRVVRDVMEQQWLENLPPGRKTHLAKATDAEKASLINRWHNDERQRNLERIVTLSGQDGRMQKFREEVMKYVKTELEPKLTPKEKNRLQGVRVPGSPNYLRQVLVLSENHGLKPPGPPDIWDRIRLTRRPQ
jgi:hypothetical protein